MTTKTGATRRTTKGNLDKWYVGLECEWCGERVLQKGQDATFHYEVNLERGLQKKWAEHGACKAERRKWELHMAQPGRPA